MTSLVWSDTILDDASRTRDRVEADLQRAQIPGSVVLTGPASMPGVLTKGDIDLHLRVPPDQFEAVVRELRNLYLHASLHSWAATLAVFHVPAEIPTGLAVTPLDSPHDRRFTSTWNLLRDDPGLLAQYNILKSSSFGTARYEEQKSEFFSRIADAP
jgi:hypothetical protein